MVQLHFQGLVQHFFQGLKADLSLQSGKIQVIAQNGKLQACQHWVGGGADLAPDGLQPLQNKAVGVLLFLTEAIVFQTVVLVQKLRYLGAEPGRADILRGGQVHPHHVSGKCHGLRFCAKGAYQVNVPLQMAQKALGIHGNTHTFSFSTNFLKSWGWSRWTPGMWASSGNTT